MTDGVGKLEQILTKPLSTKNIDKILTTTAKKVHKDILALAPEDTGAYKASIQISDVEHDGTKHSIKIYTNLSSGWKDVPLGCLLEWGTGKIGEETNNYDHGYPYRQTPWVYYNERYGRWVFTRGNKARPHFYPGLHNNYTFFKTQILTGITKEGLK